VALTGLHQERVPAKSSGVGIQLPFWPVWLAGHELALESRFCRDDLSQGDRNASNRRTRRPDRTASARNVIARRNCLEVLPPPGRYPPQAP